MKLDTIGLAGAFSYALDCIEAELVNISDMHGKRVAYISVCMAERFGIEGEALQDLAVCALMHDNALTQYIYEEFHNDLSKAGTAEMTERQLGIHCIYGEENLKKFPFKTNVESVILYHHENADGTGPFGKTWTEIPLFARIIHLCDMVDCVAGAEYPSETEKWNFVRNYLDRYTDQLFDKACVDAFLHVFSEEKLGDLRGADLEKLLWEKIPRTKQECDETVCYDLAEMFGKIIDYKSEFTSRHSLGVASKAAELAAFLGYDKEDVLKMYLAGTFHDIGKMAVGNEILEKPGRLTQEEFSKMKNHAGYTYLILSEVEDFEDVRDWAALHHEKLDGSGYPFGKTAAELNEPERIMACVDIYQALTEDRPYKKGMTHEQSCAILDDMAQKGQLDKKITNLIRTYFAS